MKVYRANFCFLKRNASQITKISIVAASQISLGKQFVEETKDIVSFHVLDHRDKKDIRKEIWKEGIKWMEELSLPLVENKRVW